MSAVILRDARGRVLTVRKRGTHTFMFPGGKPEAGESSERTAIRELREEVGALLDASKLRALGMFRTRAANEAGMELEAMVFEHPAVRIGEPAAEIAELRWVDFCQPLSEDLAPLCLDLAPALGQSRSEGHSLRVECPTESCEPGSRRPGPAARAR